MDEKFYQIAEQIVQLHQKSYEVYFEAYRELWEDEDSYSVEFS